MKSICFVCGSKGANSILHVKPRSKGAYFSFLESHDPPKGAKLPNGEGVVSSCLVCYAFLSQQWDSFERSKTPLVKRLYWLKRIDNRSFTGAELNVQGEYVAQIMGVQYNCGLSGNVSPFDYGSHTGISCNMKDAIPSPTNDSNLSSSVDNAVERLELNAVLDLSVSPKKPKSQSRKSQKSDDASVANASKALGSKLQNSSKSIGYDAVSSAKQKNGSIVCYVCCKTCPASLARFVYAIKYSDDEPYFPFILGLAEPRGAMALTKNGVTQVCSECRKTLSRQWRIFESRKVAEMDRIYKINDAPIVVEKTTKENGDGGSGNVTTRSGGSACYLCGDVTLLSSMFTLRTREEEGGGEVDVSQIVLPFIEKLKCPLGARPINSRGTVLVCVLCHDHIRCQWQKFEENNLPLDRREYMLRPFLNANSSIAFAGSNSIQSVVAERRNSRRIPCLREEETSLNAGKESVIPALDRGFSDASGRTVAAFSDDTAYFRMPFPSPLLLRMDCNKNMTTKMDDTTRFERLTFNGHKSNEQNDDIAVTCCSLCGFRCKKLKNSSKSSFVAIYDRPKVNESCEDNKSCFVRPFFPFLSTISSPSSVADVVSDDGCFNVCFVCYHNLVGQWFAFEKSKDLEEQNRWLRKYRLRCFVCSVCRRQNSDRQKMEIVTMEEYPSALSSVIVDGLVSIDGSECGLVCSICLERLRRNNAEENGRRSGKTMKRSAGVRWPKTVAESLAKLDARDEHLQTKISSNSSSSSSLASLVSVAAAAKESEKQQSSQSSSSSSTTSSSPTDADIKTVTVVAADTEIRCSSESRRRRKRGLEQRREGDDEEGVRAAHPPPPASSIPSQHLFHHHPTPTPAAMTSSSSSSSNSYLEALRRMTIDSCNRTTTMTVVGERETESTIHNHDLSKRLEAGINESQSEVKMVLSVKEDLSLAKKSNLNDEKMIYGGQRSFINNDIDEMTRKSHQQSCNGLLRPVITKEEDEEAAVMMTHGNPTNNTSITNTNIIISRKRCSSRASSSTTTTKTDDVFCSSSALKKTKSPCLSGPFPSSPLPPPSHPPVAAIDGSCVGGGRHGYNGFIHPPPSSSSSIRMLNPGPFHPSLVLHPPHPSPQHHQQQHLSSSASPSSSSFMSPNALYLPQLIHPSSSSSSSLFSLLPPHHHPSTPHLPSSSSTLRWEEYLLMQKLQLQQQMMSSSSSTSSFLPYSTVFPPSLSIHPLLQPNAISTSPFLFTADRCHSSIGLPSAFDLSNILRRDIYKRHDDVASDDTNELESSGSYWRNGAALKKRRRTNSDCSGQEEDEEEERNDLLRTRDEEEEVYRKDFAKDDARSQGDAAKVTTEQRETRKDMKPNFHRPFLENYSDREVEEERELELESRRDLDYPPSKNDWSSVGDNKPVNDDIDVTYPSVLRTENYKDHVTSASIKSNSLIEANHNRLIAELNGGSHPKNGHLATINHPKSLDGLSSTNGFTDVLRRYASTQHLSKDELLNAALSLISLQSTTMTPSSNCVLGLAKKRTNEQRKSTTVALDDNDESKDNDISRCHRSMNKTELSSQEKTNPSKRLRLDLDDRLMTTTTTTTTSLQPINNDSNCATRHSNKQKQSLPIDRLLSSPPPPPPPPPKPPGDDEMNYNISSPPSPASTLNADDGGDNGDDGDGDGGQSRLQWPGIEAIIEAYQQHCQDYACERQFLYDEGIKNDHNRRLLLSSRETFSAKIVELTETQRNLDDERIQLQSFLDNIASCIRQLR